MPAPDLADLITYAEARNSKLILAGDTSQLRAVENGGGMPLLGYNVDERRKLVINQNEMLQDQLTMRMGDKARQAEQAEAEFALTRQFSCQERRKCQCRAGRQEERKPGKERGEEGERSCLFLCFLCIFSCLLSFLPSCSALVFFLIFLTWLSCSALVSLFLFS